MFILLLIQNIKFILQNTGDHVVHSKNAINRSQITIMTTILLIGRIQIILTFQLSCETNRKCVIISVFDVRIMGHFVQNSISR